MLGGASASQQGRQTLDLRVAHCLDPGATLFQRENLARNFKRKDQRVQAFPDCLPRHSGKPNRRDRCEPRDEPDQTRAL